MKALYWLGAILGGVVAHGLHRAWKDYLWREQPNYVDAIAKWKPDTPLALPPIQPLQAKKVNDWRTRRFQQRGRL